MPGTLAKKKRDEGASTATKPSRKRLARPTKIDGAALYQVHDNGGRPFTVLVDEDPEGATRVRLYLTRNHRAVKGDIPREYTAAEYKLKPPRPSELKRTWARVERVWIGRHTTPCVTAKESLGNSLLLRLAPARKGGAAHRYVHIGAVVYGFVTADPITAFESPVGNSDVPYPVALSKSEVFFLGDDLRMPRDATRAAGKRDFAQDSPRWATIYDDLFGTPSQQKIWRAQTPPCTRNPAAMPLEGRRVLVRRRY